MSSLAFISVGFIVLLAMSTTAVFALCITSLVLGIRCTHAPECRACKESLTGYEKILTQCPACNRKISSARDVYFRGRYRPKKLWIICILSCLPFVTMILISIGVSLNYQRLMGIDNQDPAMGIVDAMRMETDELIETLATRPEGRNGWRELSERFSETPPTPEQITSLSVSIGAGLDAHLAQSPDEFEPNFGLAMSLATLYDSVGFMDPKIQEFIQPLINIPSECPEIEVKRGRLLITIQTTPNTYADHNLLNFSDLTHAFVTNAIRIDGLDVPIQMYRGRSNWSTIDTKHRIRISDLPESMTTPGEHSIELDLTNTILPTDIVKNTPCKLWPNSITKKFHY